jgi:hypothetical protein
MPRVTARQIWITVLMAVVVAPVFLSAGSAAFRPAWLTARLAVLPVSAWITLAVIAVALVMVRIISAAVFAQGNDTNEGDDR